MYCWPNRSTKSDARASTITVAATLTVSDSGTVLRTGDTRGRERDTQSLTSVGSPLGTCSSRYARAPSLRARCEIGRRACVVRKDSRVEKDVIDVLGEARRLLPRGLSTGVDTSRPEAEGRGNRVVATSRARRLQLQRHVVVVRRERSRRDGCERRLHRRAAARCGDGERHGSGSGAVHHFFSSSRSSGSEGTKSPFRALSVCSVVTVKKLVQRRTCTELQRTGRALSLTRQTQNTHTASHAAAPLHRAHERGPRRTRCSSPLGCST